MGLLANGTIGFGMLLVRGRKRVPNPPAMMTAFMGGCFLGLENGIQHNANQNGSLFSNPSQFIVVSYDDSLRYCC
jgi:hypothetical protein